MKGDRLKHIVSISLGTPHRDFSIRIKIANRELLLVRIGVNGNLHRAAQLIAELDGHVDAIGLGGINLNYRVNGLSYPCPEGKWLASHSRHTPVVDGSGVKEKLEPLLVQTLAYQFGWTMAGKQALVVSVLDRPDLASALSLHGCRLMIGDAAFGLKLPVWFSSMRTFSWAAYFTMPLLRHLPIRWLYPLGGKQMEHENRFAAQYDQADIIAGDFHFIRRYIPSNLAGKRVITSTLTAGDISFLRERGVTWVASASPLIHGRTFGANVLEAAMIACGLAETDIPPYIQQLKPED